jgi:hypothetical protein
MRYLSLEDALLIANKNERRSYIASADTIDMLEIKIFDYIENVIKNPLDLDDFIE